MPEATARGLVQARERLLLLTDFDEPELRRQHSPLMSPLVWDLAHVGQQEDLWLLRGGDAARDGVLPAEIERLYDAFQFARGERATLPLLSPTQAREFLVDVRGRVLEQVDSAPDLFPFAMVEQHEQQHIETILATHQLREGPPLLGKGALLPSGRRLPGDAIFIPAGPFQLGVDADTEPRSLDNERPAHRADLPAFRIGRVPVTNAEWQEFIDADGYGDRRWWSERGWQHRIEADLERPLFWSADGSRRRFGVVEDIPADEPVQHICFFEAEAYAAWAGARLPTEAEWEKAGAWDPEANRRRRWPWGDQPRPTRPDPSQPRRGGPATGAGWRLSERGVRVRGRAADR
jgi:iron(II)-dependent oxidoreductase